MPLLVSLDTESEIGEQERQVISKDKAWYFLFKALLYIFRI